MKIKRLIGGNLESNGYIIYNKEGGECYIIDPGYQPDRFIKTMDQLNVSLKGILLTHHHYDHVGGVERIQKSENCPVYLHREDLDLFKNSHTTALEDGDCFLLGDEEIKVIHTPGHTKGGVCFYVGKSKVAFTGDTIFNVDLGRTDLNDGSETEMVNSISNIINKWGNDITIYPGHGDPCSMKYVRTHNREFIDIVGKE